MIDKWLLTMKATEIECPPEESWVEGVSKYRVKIKSPILGKLKVEWRCGPACGDPEIMDVLHSCQLDYTEESFHNWAYILGFDAGVLSNLKIYEACIETSEKLRLFWGPSLDEFLNYEFD